MFLCVTMYLKGVVFFVAPLQQLFVKIERGLEFLSCLVFVVFVAAPLNPTPAVKTHIADAVKSKHFFYRFGPEGPETVTNIYDFAYWNPPVPPAPPAPMCSKHAKHTMCSKHAKHTVCSKHAKHTMCSKGTKRKQGNKQERFCVL